MHGRLWGRVSCIGGPNEGRPAASGLRVFRAGPGRPGRTGYHTEPQSLDTHRRHTDAHAFVSVNPKPSLDPNRQAKIQVARYNDHPRHSGRHDRHAAVCTERPAKCDRPPGVGIWRVYGRVRADSRDSGSPLRYVRNDERGLRPRGHGAESCFIRQLVGPRPPHPTFQRERFLNRNHSYLAGGSLGEHGAKVVFRLTHCRC